MRQLQQQEGLTGQNVGEASLHSPHPNQFRLPYDQSNPLPISKNNAITGSHNGIDSSKHGSDQIRLQVPQENQAQNLPMPRVHSIEGLHQLQGVDNMTALNNLLQQHQQSSIPNNPNQAIAPSLGTATQSLHQQLATLQQHQLQPQNSQPHPQQVATTTLHENLLQLQKLQEQQQQILKSISHNTGLIDSNSLLNPLGTLLTTLIGQISRNNSSTTSNNSNSIDTGNNNINSNNSNMNNSMNHDPNNNSALVWGQMGGIQQQLQPQPPNNSLHTPAGIMPSVQPPIQHQPQQQKTGFVGTSNAPLEPPRRLRMQPSTRRTNEQRQRFISNNSSSGDSSRGSSRGSSPPTNINIEFPTSPIIRKTESSKKQRPKSFPTQLWDAMMTGGPMDDEAFEWLPDGKSFVVVNSEFFCQEILDRKFKQSKYGSFVRKLHRWGFIRLTSGTGTDCFHHPLFQKSRPELVSQIKCNSRTGKDGCKKGHNAYTRGEVVDNVQPSLMGVEKFIRAKVVSTEIDTDTDDPMI